MPLTAVIFDLDGVLTDTAELHYRAWQRLADEEHLPFSRQKNEQLRGVSRSRSLALILGEHEVAPEHFAEMMARKNGYYQEQLTTISSEHLLPGIPALLDALEQGGVQIAVGSASKNARQVLDALGIAQRFAVIADGRSVAQAKPAPDLFLHAARAMGVEPHDCVVVEDAESGIDAALTGGFATLGVGPESRVGHAHLRVDHTGQLTLDRLRNAHRHAETWRVVERDWNPARMAHKETVFTLGNGLASSRGVFEEGLPGERRTTFVHGIFDDMPISFTEVVNAPDWMALDIRLDGERFRLDEGSLRDYQRSLDLRAGLLSRTVRWESPSGKRTHLRFERVMSLATRELLALRLQIVPENWTGSVEVRGALFGHVDNLGLMHWEHLGQGEQEGAIWLRSRTRHTGVELALTSQLRRDDGEAALETWDVLGQPTQRLCTLAQPGETVTLSKLVTLADSRHHADPLAAALDAGASARNANFDQHLAANRRAWQQIWQHADVEIEGDDEAQVAIRYNIFQMYIVAPQQAEDDVSIGAKTLSGFGYRGHAFWDTELFMLPLFTFTQPAIARNLLLYRHRRLDAARQKARANGYEGAWFAWESADTGEEVTPVWVPHFTDPRQLVRVWTGDLAIHISADVAYAVMQYWRATGDDAFMVRYGAELVLDGAVFWGSRAEWNEEADRYEFTDVIGPDEYHDHVNNNIFTNGMARWHLEAAISVLDWLDAEETTAADTLRAALDLSAERLDRWREIIAKVLILEDPESGLIEQFQGYFDLADPPLADYEPRSVSLHEILGIEGANEVQFIKQPDVLMWLFLQRDELSQETLRANWNYYDPRTDHTYGSSLGPAITAIMACEMGEPDVAYEHFMRAARADLFDVRGNAADGIHAASAAALWQAAVMGFGGFRLTEEGWDSEPHLPTHWRRLAFTICYRGESYHIQVEQAGKTMIDMLNGATGKETPRKETHLSPTLARDGD